MLPLRIAATAQDTFEFGFMLHPSIVVLWKACSSAPRLLCATTATPLDLQRVKNETAVPLVEDTGLETAKKKRYFRMRCMRGPHINHSAGPRDHLLWIAGTRGHGGPGWIEGGGVC